MNACPPSRTRKTAPHDFDRYPDHRRPGGAGCHSRGARSHPAAGSRLRPSPSCSSLKTLEVTPALKDSATTVDKAANVKGVMKLLGIQLHRRPE